MDHQHKLQLVTTTTCVQVECLHQLKSHKQKVRRSECKVQISGHKVQRSGPASALVSTGCNSNMQLQPPSITTQMQGAQHDAAINATCLMAMFVEKIVSPYTSYIDCCIVVCCSYLIGGGCSCMLLPHPIYVIASLVIRSRHNVE